MYAALEYAESTPQDAEAVPVFPAGSVARMTSVWTPSESPLSTTGDAHAVAAWPSSAHVAFAGSSVENANVAVRSGPHPSGPESMVTTGARVSTVHVHVAEPE